MDEKKKVYFTEMQKRNTGNLRKRSRYYQAQLDVSLLEPGTIDFNQLNDSCFILIAPFDIFGKGLYRYTFEGTCRECPELKLEDGVTRIFINTKGTNEERFSQEFLDLMEYIIASTDEVAALSESPKIKLLHQNVKKIRVSEKMGVKYMQKWEELAYAKEEGEKLHLIKQVSKKLAKGKTLECIAEELEADMAVVAEICKAARDAGTDFKYEDLCERLHIQAV